MTETTSGTAHPYVVDPRLALDEALTAAAPVIAAVADLDPSAPTPCPDLNRGAMLAHLNAVSERILAMGHGKPATSVPDSVPSDDYPAAWSERAQLIRGAWDRLPLDQPVGVPWGVKSAADAGAIYAAEIVVHAWDLASTSGIDFDISEALAEVGLSAYRREVPPESRGAIFEALRNSLPPEARFDDPFAAAVEVGPGATPIQRLVAMSGRMP